MALQQFFVVPITHVDLAWKRGRDEMSEMLEVVVIRLLDALEHDPSFKYLIEQAAHFRELNHRRPDLVARLKPFVQAGRIEFVGGMASTLENNIPNGECLIRNQAMGLLWARENWGAQVETGWLVDTFGINAQVPQILRGFGIGQFMANRFGGGHTHDLFRARGLDNSEVTVAGWCTYAAYMRPQNVAEYFCKNWDGIEEVFRRADALAGPGPFMVLPYTENEMLISLRPLRIIEERNRERAGQSWRMATPRDFFAAIEESVRNGRVLPVVSGDLNPEFTGCFSLRQPIRTRNRAVETRLLEAEKWAALSSIDASDLEEAWWKLHYVQFHDVFTGSHPTEVFLDVMATLDGIQVLADDVLARSLACLAPPATAPASTWRGQDQHIFAFNGLPWERRDIIEVPLPHDCHGVARVSGSQGDVPFDVPFEVRGNSVRVVAPVPAVGFAGFSIEPGAPASADWRQAEAATLENKWIRLDLDRESGIARLEWKPTGAVLLQDANDWLIAQSDGGNFQIESPNGAEVPASLGPTSLKYLQSPLGQSVLLSGEFPPLHWAGPDSFLRYSAEFFLAYERAEVRLDLRLEWHGEATRVRLKLASALDTSVGIYEIPFGVVARKPYTPRTNARGEWPAHRFVAVESGGHGLALANTGVVGVEVNGGTITTTVLRAPVTSYAGMEADSTSSQHGEHLYRFSILPFAGPWADADVAKFAQELNNPILMHAGEHAGAASSSASLLQLEPSNVILSGVKAAQDGSGAVIVRVYETVGRATEAALAMPAARRVFACDLAESSGDEIPTQDGVMRFALRPFEIRSFRCLA